MHRRMFVRFVAMFKKCSGLRKLSVTLFNEIIRTRALTIGAAVAFFGLMSLVPLLMMAAALLSVLPIPNLFDQLLNMLAVIVPPDAMTFVSTVLQSILTSHPTRIFSIGILSYLWAASGCFSSLIEALDIAYDVPVERSWIRTRMVSLLLTFICGGLFLITLLCVLAGPKVVHLIAEIMLLPHGFLLIWQPLRAVLMFVLVVANIMLLYHIGPNRKTRFKTALPGAAVAVSIWFLGSMGLDFYLAHFSNYSATYGSLGAIIILMLWLYLTTVSILIGAELNAELWKRQNPELAKARGLSTNNTAPILPSVDV
jgi:membrane protein